MLKLHPILIFTFSDTKKTNHQKLKIKKKIQFYQSRRKASHLSISPFKKVIFLWKIKIKLYKETYQAVTFDRSNIELPEFKCQLHVLQRLLRTPKTLERERSERGDRERSSTTFSKSNLKALTFYSYATQTPKYKSQTLNRAINAHHQISAVHFIKSKTLSSNGSKIKNCTN